MRHFLIFLLLLVSIRGFAAEHTDSVTIKGYAPEYAGYNLVLKYHKNFISKETSQLINFPVNKKGAFKAAFALEQITQAFMDLGQISGYLFLEPGKSYELVLPPFQPKKDADRFNPYFIPEKIQLGIANQEAQHLNNTIRDFQEAFEQRYNQNALKLFNTNSIKLADKLTNELDALYPSQNNTYFSTYKYYSFAKFYMLSLKRQKKKIIHQYFSEQPVHYQSPAYWDAFNQLFQNFFNYYFSTSSGRKLKQAFVEGLPFDSLSLVMGHDSIYQQADFRESVLLKGFYDSFYSGKYNEDRIIEIITQASEKGCNERIRLIAQSINAKINHLRTGTKAPEFNLYTLNGKEKTLENYKGKFVYLNFCHSQNYACLKDFQPLNTISQQMKRDLTVISIVTDENLDMIDKLVKDNKYRWDFLSIGANAKVLFDYSINALPTYYLIDPEGNLLLSPAPAPGESFGEIFSEALRNYRYKQLRKERPKEKSIFDL